MEAEKIQEDPRQVLSKVWARIGLEDCPSAFDWQVETVPADWKAVSGWHQSVSAATGIRPPADDAGLAAKFAAAVAETPKLQRFLDQHLPFYERLKAEAV